MTTAKKLILIVVSYLTISTGLSALYHVHQDGTWFRSHVQWTYLVWTFRGPLSGVEYGWHGLAPIWQHLWTFLAGGPVVVSFMSLPVFFRGQVSARLCVLGLILWGVLAASLLGPPDLEARVERAIAVVADLR